jgi:hypothetical protein
MRSKQIHFCLWLSDFVLRPSNFKSPISYLRSRISEKRNFAASGLQAEPRPPVFILVCKNTALANVVFEWLANGNFPSGIPPAKLEGFRNSDAVTNTIVVHSKVVHETDSDAGKSDESRWMRFTLDTVGK